MIKIRYADLPAGLHVRVEAEGGHTVVYLLPGLTPAERRAALRRSRSSARIGHGPALPAAGLARAVVADRLRTGARNGAAACRAHPALVIPPVVIVASVAFAYLLLSSVSIHFRTAPTVSGRTVEPGRVTVPALPPQPPAPSPPSPRRAARPQARRSSPGQISTGLTGFPGTSPAAGSGGRGRHPHEHTPSIARRHRYSSAGPSPFSPKPTPSLSSPGMSPTPTANPTPAPSVTSLPDGSGSAGGGSSGACLNVGPLGVCLTL